MSTQQENEKKIKTESGTWIKASFKTGKYGEWKNKQNADFDAGSGDEGSRDTTDTTGQFNRDRLDKIFNRRRSGAGQKRNGGKVEGGLVKPEQILKQRKMQAKQDSRGRGGSRGGARGSMRGSVGMSGGRGRGMSRGSGGRGRGGSRGRGDSRGRGGSRGRGRR